MTTVGILRETGAGNHYVEINGEVKPIQPVSDAPKNILLELEIEGDTIVSWDYTGPLQKVNLTDKNICLARVVSDERYVTEERKQKLDRIRKDMLHFFRVQCHGRWTLSCTSYLYADDQSRTLESYSFQQAPIEFDDHNYWWGIGGFRSGLSGHAWLGGTKAWNYTSEGKVIWHEGGHNFGAGHSATPDHEYGSPSNMAKGTDGFNAHHLYKLKLMHDEEIIEAEDKGTYFLLPIECDPRDRINGEYRAIRLVNGHTKFILSTRKSRSQHFTGVREEGQIQIHSPKTNAWTSSTSVYHGIINEGDVKEVNGFQIKHAGTKDGVVMVEVNGGSTADVQFPQPLKPPKGDALSEPMIWHDPEHKQQGIWLIPIPDENRVIGFWFTYHPKGEHRDSNLRQTSGHRWLEIQGEIKDGYTDLKFYYPDNEKSMREVGSGTLTVSDNSGKLRCYTSLFGRINLSLEPTTQPMKDVQIWETGTSEGYVIGDVDSHTVAYHFGYSGRDQRWLECHGNRTTVERYHHKHRFMETEKGTYNSIGTIDFDNNPKVIFKIKN